MRCSNVFFAALMVLTSFASFGLAQFHNEYASTLGDRNGSCSVYGSCAAIESTAGCSCQQDDCQKRHFHFWSRDQDYFEYEPILPCPGDRVNSIMELQKLNGRTAQLVFHNFHFEWNSYQQDWTISQSGWNHVQELVRILARTPGAIQVTPSGDSDTDLIRLKLLQEAFANSGLSQTPLFVLQTPVVRGLSGNEALRIYEQRQQGSPFSLGASRLSSQAIPGGDTIGR